ncbi:MAG: ABC transporter permease [Oscillospiraceae bacterium]|nr:ABC transporter permease [Oscillospiraceae bacterium]
MLTDEANEKVISLRTDEPNEKVISLRTDEPNEKVTSLRIDEPNEKVISLRTDEANEKFAGNNNNNNNNNNSSKDRALPTVYIALIMVVVIAFAGFAFVLLRVRNLNAGELLLITPKAADGRGIDIESLSDINAGWYTFEADTDRVLLTYEIASIESVKASNAGYSATLIKTNHTYPHVMEYRLLSGAFFTENDEIMKQRAVTLNHTAAYSLFGNLDVVGTEVVIGGDRFFVTGVIQNPDDESLFIYAPAACFEDKPDSVIVRLDSKAGISEEYVKNVLKSVAVSDSKYDFVNLSFISALINRLPITALKFIGVCVLALVFYLSVNGLVRDIRSLRRASGQFYFTDLLTGRAKGATKFVAVKPVLTLIFLAIAVVTFIWVFPSLAEDFLAIGDSYGFLQTSYASFYSSNNPSAIGNAVYSMQLYLLASLFLLAVFGLCAAVFSIFSLTKLRGRGQSRGRERGDGVPALR